MESYEKNSYQPETLDIGINGRTGQNREPFSCVKNSLDQNILILSYEEPVTVTDLSKALGVPMAFLEESVDKLVASGLMKREKSKIFTDFVIFSSEDSLKALEISISSAHDTFEEANPAFLYMVKKYKEIDGFSNMGDTYLYILAVLSCRQNFYIRIAEKIGGIDQFDNFPDRPNHGKWIAMGSKCPHGHDFNNKNVKYSVSGRSGTDAISENILSSCEWDTYVGRTHCADFKYSITERERALAIDAVRTGTANAFQAELIPDLERLCFIKTENSKKIPAIPYINKAGERRFFEIETEGSDIWCEKLLNKATEIAKNNIPKYPARIKQIPGVVYTLSMSNLPMAYIYEADERGVITLEKDKCYPIMYIVTK